MEIDNFWIVLDKPKNITSRKALNIIQKIFVRKKLGYVGTLDPIATGVLPIAFGSATRLIEYAHYGSKEYTTKIQFGFLTDSLDYTGLTVKSTYQTVSKKDLVEILKTFIGEIEQIPPKFSAVKINGVRAYKLAREGVDFKVKPRKVMINKISLLEFDEFEQTAVLRVNCNEGTYIRSLIRDIAAQLDNFATILELRRTKSGVFEEKLTFKLEKIEKMVHNGNALNLALPLDYVLDDIPDISVDSVTKCKFVNGIGFRNFSYDDQKIVVVRFNDKFLGIGKVKDGFINPHKIFIR